MKKYANSNVKRIDNKLSVLLISLQDDNAEENIAAYKEAASVKNGSSVFGGNVLDNSYFTATDVITLLTKIQGLADYAGQDSGVAVQLRAATTAVRKAETIMGNPSIKRAYMINELLEGVRVRVNSDGIIAGRPLDNLLEGIDRIVEEGVFSPDEIAELDRAIGYTR